MPRYSLLLTMTLLLLSTSFLSAQGLYLGPQLGYFKSADADNGTFMGGAAFRMKLTPTIGVEGSLQYRQESYANDRITVHNWPVMITGMIYPLPIVYGLAGIGYYNSSITFDPQIFPGVGDRTSQDIGWHFGGGLELPAGSNLVTADLRYVFLNYNFTAVPGSSAISANFFVLTVGYEFSL